MPTRWRCPPESASARESCSPESPTRSSIANAPAMSCGGKRRSSAAKKPTEASRPDSTFSITVSRSTRLNSWKIIPMRRRAARSSRVGSPTISVAPSRMLPAVGSTSRLMQRISVLLPAPELPMTATTSGRSTVKETSLSACVPPG